MVYLRKIDALKGFGVSEKETGNEFSLHERHYRLFGYEAPSNLAPTIGVVMGTKKGYFYCSAELIQAFAELGVRMKFLTTVNAITIHQEMKELDALVLPDNDLDIPGEYYVDGKAGGHLSPQTDTALQCIIEAQANELPILAIGQGALLLAGSYGLKLYSSESYIETPIHHGWEDHAIEVIPETPFHVLVGRKEIRKVNSHHAQFVAPLRVQKELLGENLPLDFYAFAIDGMPEAFGKLEKGVLGLLWNPEVMAVKGCILQKKILKLLQP